ncbi:D-aminoacyl-tRNA deacylase [Myroides sp. LJL119]
MRTVIQRVKSANVMVDQKVVGQINQGLLVLVGFEQQDTKQDMQWLSNKIVNLRIFADQQGVMNQSILDLGGDILLVSQFTLHAMTKKGNRPSYIMAAKPEVAHQMYNEFIEILQGSLSKDIQTGIFGADMQVSLVNDGPVTIWIDTKNKQ